MCLNKRRHEDWSGGGAADAWYGSMLGFGKTNHVTISRTWENSVHIRLSAEHLEPPIDVEGNTSAIREFLCRVA